MRRINTPLHHHHHLRYRSRTLHSPNILLPRLAGRLIHDIRISGFVPLLLVLESLDFLIKIRI